MVLFLSFSPKKFSYQLDDIHAYILKISLPIPIDMRHCETLGAHPTIKILFGQPKQCLPIHILGHGCVEIIHL